MEIYMTRAHPIPARSARYSPGHPAVQGRGCAYVYSDTNTTLCAVNRVAIHMHRTKRRVKLSGGDQGNQDEAAQAAQRQFDAGYAAAASGSDADVAAAVKHAHLQTLEVAQKAARPRTTAEDMAGRLPVVRHEVGAPVVAIASGGTPWVAVPDEEAAAICRLHEVLVKADLHLEAAGNEDKGRSIVEARMSEAIGSGSSFNATTLLTTLRALVGQDAIERAVAELRGDDRSFYEQMGASEARVSAEVLDGSAPYCLGLPLPGWVALAQAADLSLALVLGQPRELAVPAVVMWPRDACVVSLDQLRRTRPSAEHRRLALALVLGVWPYPLRAFPEAAVVQPLTLIASVAKTAARRQRGPPKMAPHAPVNGSARPRGEGGAGASSARTQGPPDADDGGSSDESADESSGESADESDDESASDGSSDEDEEAEAEAGGSAASAAHGAPAAPRR